MVSVLANGQKISGVHWNEVEGERSEDEREKERERVVVCGTASARNICITIVRRSPPYRRHTHSWIMHTPSTEPPVCTPHSERGPSARVAMCTPQWEPPASNPRFYREGCLRRSRNTTQCSRSRDTNASRRRITCVFISVKAYLRRAHVHYIVVSRRSLSFLSFEFFHSLLFFVSFSSRFERRYFAAGIYHHAFKIYFTRAQVSFVFLLFLPHQDPRKDGPSSNLFVS